MHFLKQLIQKPVIEEPIKDHMDIHRHFYRYSRGEFIGPAIKISSSSTKFTLKGSHEYEDLILELVTKSIENKNQDFEIKGRLISGVDLSDEFSKFNLDWEIKKSTGKTKNYKSDFLDLITPNKLLELNSLFRQNSYFLVNFNINSTCKIVTKKNIPQPSKKKLDEDDVGKRIQFCRGYIKNNESNYKLISDAVLPDFKDRLPQKWKNIVLYNNYIVNDIILPEKVQDSRLLRILALRKGKLIRSVDIDDETFENQFSFVA